MKKRIGLMILLFIMAFVFGFRSGQPIKYIVENDGVIEWQSHEEKELI